MTPKVGFNYDESIPVEKSAMVFQNVGDIIVYNGINVNWKQYKMTRGVQIPAGDTLLEWNIQSNDILGKNILFRYNFQPNKQYTFWVCFRNEDHEDENFSYKIYGLQVFAYDFGHKITYSDFGNEKYLVGFVPFLNVEKEKLEWGKWRRGI